MIITPMILPQIPEPSSSDCATLLSYTNSLINGLESVLNRLYEVSSVPDEAMVLICNKIETMLLEANTMQSNLNLIKSESVNKMNFYNQSKTLV